MMSPIIERSSEHHITKRAAVICGAIFIAVSVQFSRAATPVEWPTSTGGNGHFYEAVYAPQGISWTAASNAAASAGGYLATIVSQAENQFVFAQVDDAKYWHQLPDPNNHGPWLGGYQLPGAPEPAGGWVWVTGEAFTFTNWFAGTQEPTGGPWLGQNEDRLQYSSASGTRAPTWNDIPNILPPEYAVYGYIVEYNSRPPEQVLSYTGGTLTENFDGMGRLGTNTPPGWFVGFGVSANTTVVTPGMGLQAPTATILGWNLGSTNGVGANADTDRALGSGPTGAGNDGIIEVRIVNNSGQPIAAFEVRYDGEEWRTPQGASPADQLVLQFSTNGTTFTALGAGFDFIRPVTSPATSALDGNLPANRIANRGGVFAPATPIPVGATFYLRWFDVNDAGITDGLLAIDNFRFTATTLQPVAIVTQPQDAVRTAGEAVTFNVGASGVPVFYQWLSNGVPISGATASDYTVASTTTNMSGSGFSVIVSNSLNRVTSRVATLAVYPNLTWPLASLTNTLWRYNQSGADLGAAWKEPGYNDTSWLAGSGVLAQENQVVVNPLTHTILSLTKPTGEPIITYYFRTTFTVTNPAEIAFLTFTNLIDDGCVAWLNGRELYRINLDSGPVTATTLAANATEGVFIVTNVPASDLLVAGTNVLAVEVHQTTTNSSDVVMGLAMKANPWNGGPVVIVQPPQNEAVNSGDNMTFSVQVSGYPPLSYQWRFNGVDMAGSTASNLTLSNATLASDGFYSVRVSNTYGSILSEPVRLLLNDQRLTPFYASDFEAGVGAEWSTQGTDVTPMGARKYLGQFSNQTVTLVLSNLPAHSQVTVAFDLFVILSWNGNWVPMGPDRFTLRDRYGPVLLDTTFNIHPAGLNQECFDSGQAFPDSFPGGYHPPLTGAAETNSLGYEGWGWPLDAVYRLRYTWAHTNANLLVDFVAAQLQAIDDESWGLDNVKVYLDNGAVAGWPVAFNPSSLSVTNGQFRVQLTEMHGPGAIVLEASTDLQHWDAISTNTPVNGAVDFTIPVGAHLHRFFRARQ